jgi:cell division transport system permease protein
MTDAERSYRLQLAAYRRQSRLALRRTSPLVPENTIAGNALTIVIAIMSFLACLTLGAVTLVRDASRDWQVDLLREITIQVRPIEGIDTAAEAAKAAAIAAEFPGVAGVSVLDDEENVRLLEPWLGSDLDMSELPIPRLIVVRLANSAVIDLDELSRRLRTEIRGANLDDHRLWTKRLQTMANVTVVVGASILSLVFVATILSVVFATRGAMASNRDVVSVLHFVGADDGFIAREFQRHFLLLGLKGGLLGALAAAVLFALLSFAIGPSMSNAAETGQVAALFGQFAIGPIGYFGALGIAFLIAVMTAVTSRLTVYRYLAEQD